MQAYAQRILRALADADTNKWTRYWRARADCAPPRNAERTRRARVLAALTAAICAQLDALLGVNPADYPPRGENRAVGLLLNEPGAALGYTLFVVSSAQKAYLLDPLGRIAHAWHLQDALPGETLRHATLLDNGSLLALGKNGVWEVDPRGNVLWQYNTRGIHHDFIKMPNGNVTLLVQGRKTREDAIAAGANPEFVHKDGILYDYLIEVRPAAASDGEVVWEWSVWDHLVQDFDPSKPNYGAVSEHPELIDINFPLESQIQNPLWDWLHTNAIDYNPALDQIMLSPRHFSELWIIDHSATTEESRGHSGGNGGMGGDLLYRWGNPRAYRHGDADAQRLFWQHNTHWIPPGLPGAGNILAFNNGAEFPGYERLYSSIDELAPPVDGYRYRRNANSAYPPNKIAWTYAAPARFYAPFTSGTQRLPNGNTLIADGPAGTIFQVTPDGESVWKYIIPQRSPISLWRDKVAPARLANETPDDEFPRVAKNDVYRAYWYPPDHPALQNLDLAPGAYLQGDGDKNLRDWARAAVLAADFGQPLADAHFDIYLNAYENNAGNENFLIFFKRPCAHEDARRRFFLHIIPANARDLPNHRRDHGFENRDFNSVDRDVYALDDWCIAIAPLPSYPIQRMRAGQFTDDGQVWRADINLNE